MQIIRYFLIWGCILLPCLAAAQTPEEEEPEPDAAQLQLEMKSRMMQYADDFNRLATLTDMQLRFSEGMPITVSYATILQEKAHSIEESFQNTDLRWNTFRQAMQVDIADDEELMTLMVKVQQARQLVADTLEARKQQCQALADFAEAERRILPQDTVYRALYKQAFRYSLFKNMQPQLQKLKAQEQTLSMQLSSLHTKAQQATTLLPLLRPQMNALEEQYLTIQVLSGKIQQLAYKPFIQRIKDYLIGFACVGMIILFFNLIITKIKAAKAARKQMKKYEEMMRKNGSANDYPTI